MLEQEQLGGALALSLAVLYERRLGKASRWSTYLESLPQYESLPLIWLYTLTHQQDRSSSIFASLPKETCRRSLELLKGTELYRDLETDLALLMEDYEDLVIPLTHAYPETWASDITLDEFLGVSSGVAARCFRVDEWHGDAMVPMADIFNHGTAREHVHLETEDITGEDEDSEGWIDMRMVRPAVKGEEVLNTYGDHSNAYLLAKYGFTEVDNPFDVVNVTAAEILDGLKGLSGAEKQQRFEAWLEQRKEEEDEDADVVEEEEELAGQVDMQDDGEHESIEDDDMSEWESEEEELEMDPEDIVFQINAEGECDSDLELFLQIMVPDSTLIPDVLKRIAKKRLKAYNLKSLKPDATPEEHYASILRDSEVQIWRSLQ